MPYDLKIINGRNKHFCLIVLQTLPFHCNFIKYLNFITLQNKRGINSFSGYVTRAYVKCHYAIP